MGGTGAGGKPQSASENRTAVIPHDYANALSLLLEEAAFFAALSDDTAGEAARLESLARRIREMGTMTGGPASPTVETTLSGEADAIRGWIDTGILEPLERLRRRYPDTTREFFLLADLGTGAARQLLARRVTSAEDLERRCLSGEINQWREFPAGFADRMLRALRALRHRTRRVFLPEADALADDAVKALRSAGARDRIETAGECRRRRELVSRLDLVVENGTPEMAARAFADLGWTLLPSGPADQDVSRGNIPGGIPVVAHHAPTASFGPRLVLATGDGVHLSALRRALKARNLRLTWQGVLDRKEHRINCPDEEAVYRLVDWPVIPPELRDNIPDRTGPSRLITDTDLRGIAHCHTDWTDGEGSLERMVETARSIGMRWLAVTDHSAAAEQARGLSADRLREQYVEIDRLNAGLDNFRVIKGIEADILENGEVDLGGDALSASELVIGSVHEGVPGTTTENTDRVIRAMASGLIDVLGHPTGRILKAWAGRSLDWDRLFEAAATWQVAIEINANPRRLDLDWRLIPQAAARGAWFLIGPDAHRPEGLYNMRYGVAMARKGGLGPERVLNCLDAADLVAWTRKRRQIGPPRKHGR